MSVRGTLATDADALGEYLRYGVVPADGGHPLDVVASGPPPDVRDPDDVRNPDDVRDPDNIRDPDDVRDPDNIRDPDDK
jgi:hypothetical protein